MAEIDPDSKGCPGSWLGEHHDDHAQRTQWVVWLTALMMIGEIVGGTWYGSMALVADGWHMATHAAALGIATLAYRYARRHAEDPRFTFGTGKVGELAGFASAISLGIVALLIAAESFERLLDPRPIEFLQAGLIAVLGLIVNLVSARLLHHDHDPDHDHDHEHDDHADVHAHAQKSGAPRADHHQDSNLRAAYLHVVADAFTSVLAIVGLIAGRYMGWVWMDAVAGMLGAVVIAHWSIGLARTAGRSLLDAHDDSRIEAAVRDVLLKDDAGLVISDLHLWRLGPGHHGLIATLSTSSPRPPRHYRELLSAIGSLGHVTIEVNPG